MHPNVVSLKSQTGCVQMLFLVQCFELGFFGTDFSGCQNNHVIWVVAWVVLVNFQPDAGPSCSDPLKSRHVNKLQVFDMKIHGEVQDFVALSVVFIHQRQYSQTSPKFFAMVTIIKGSLEVLTSHYTESCR